MSYIEVVQPDGTAYATLFKMGSKDERQYWRVMTERWGKLFFDSRDAYDRWCSTGRANSERRGHFPSSRRHTAQPTQLNEEGQEEFVIIEEYVVEENGDIVPE
jgi:hypothetical protein